MVKSSPKTVVTEVDKELIRAIKRLSQPLSPIPAGVSPRLTDVGDFEAVIFDVYGTLLVSGSGDVGTAKDGGRSEILRDALHKSGIGTGGAGAAASGVELLFQRIECAHRDKNSKGVDYPEVDICRIWTEVLAELVSMGYIPELPCEDTILRLAVEYECRANPVWPMPGAEELLQHLKDSGAVRGIVSNAQFFTPLLFRVFFGVDMTALGFDTDLCIWSYQQGCAKPSPVLHEKCVQTLWEKYGIRPENALYVGNDMLNDIFTARRVGMKTALFAGDMRSLRLREGDPRCRDIYPDITLTCLRQLCEVV